MSGTTSAWIVGVNCCSSPIVCSTGCESGNSRSFRKASASSPMTTTSFGWTMCSSRVSQPRCLFVRGALGELDAVRPVDGHRVDAQPLERLEHGLAGAPEERDAFLRLRRLRPVLQEEDVRERVPGAEDGDCCTARCARDLVAELVDLGDRFLQVLLVDLVGWHGAHWGHEPLFFASGPVPWPGRPTSDPGGRRATSAAAGSVPRSG